MSGNGSRVRPPTIPDDQKLAYLEFLAIGHGLGKTALGRMHYLEREVVRIGDALSARVAYIAECEGVINDLKALCTANGVDYSTLFA